MFPLKRLLFVLALLLLYGPSSVCAEDSAAGVDDQPGKGWQIPGTGFRLGGYASGGFESERHRSAMLGIDDLSLFVHWESEGKLRFFSELDLEKPVVLDDNDGLTARHVYLALERLYADYLYSEKLNVRVGKFLTPIGRWNVIHAAPLVWTTSRPLITEHSFPTNATGLMAYGTLPVSSQEIDYSIYTAIGEDWRTDPKLDPFEEAYGFHLTVPTNGYGEFGVSFANFEQRGSVGERKNLLGMDYFWSRDRYELSAELAYRLSDEDQKSDEKGLFVQGVMPVTERLYAIGRYEFFDKAGPTPPMNLWLAGVAMRLSPAMILKAEFTQATHNRIQAHEGFFASFAILF